MKPTLVSNAAVFAKLGNPWISERDRVVMQGPANALTIEVNGVTSHIEVMEPRLPKPREPFPAEQAGQVLCDSHRKKAMALHKMNLTRVKSRHSRLLIK